MNNNENHHILKQRLMPDWYPETAPVQKHSEHLYHYTNLEAFKGIYRTQELWATHATYLNDSSEITLFNKILGPIIEKYTLKKYIETCKSRPTLRFKAEQKYGTIKKAAQIESKIYTDTIFETAFNFKNSERSFSSPYIISFCTHEKDRNYIKNNGLLSQWRGYGKNGVSILFNTKKLSELLEQEKEKYLYVISDIKSVIYSHDEKSISKYFEKLAHEISKIFTEYYDTGNFNLDEAFGPYTDASIRLKHEAFEEEREVRIYACPVTHRLFDADKKAGQKRSQKPKQIHRHPRKGKMIKLFGRNDFPQLPIEKIIIGPSNNQNEIELEIRSIISGNNIELIKSQTPLIDN